jgi:hypothetical protein
VVHFHFYIGLHGLLLGKIQNKGKGKGKGKGKVHPRTGPEGPEG